jgi:alpha-methylacyl-CoA racemase
MMLADMGARVIRVDRIPGAGTGSALEAMMRNDSIVDRGRESIAVNMKDPRGIEAVLRLVDRADILVEGFRPGVMERLGLGPDVCLARNPRLVYGRMTGWGQTGPLAHAAGHDINYIALSGALHAIGPSGQAARAALEPGRRLWWRRHVPASGVLPRCTKPAARASGQVVDAAMSDGAPCARRT